MFINIRKIIYILRKTKKMMECSRFFFFRKIDFQRKILNCFNPDIK